MPIKKGEIENKRKMIPLLDIGAVNTSEDTVIERAHRWGKVIEAQMHIDWKATTAMRKRDGPIGKSFHTAWDHYQDMENLIIIPFTDKEKEDIWIDAEKQNPDMSPMMRETITASIENGHHVGVKYKRKTRKPLLEENDAAFVDRPLLIRTPGRKNKKIYVYRFIPNPYFESLGFKINYSPNTLMMNPQLKFTRKEIYEFRRTISKKIGKREKKLGVVMTCAYCKELFLSRKKQTAPYVCKKHRCRKAKVRKTEPLG